jgi:hypothetical protein
MLSEYPEQGYRLKSVQMSDLATRFALFFEKEKQP